MKTKLLFAGLVASAALVGCTNDELIETTGSTNAAKGETTLIFDGMGGVGTKMAYDNGFKWQVGDKIGVRRVMGDIVISNVKFEANKVTNDNTTDPETWADSGMGDYAFFNSQDETLHEADYIVTYPYDETSVQDGKVIGRLPVAQVANQNDGADYSNNEYAGNYGFMMSEATHFEGGQNTGHFILYPVFSRIAIEVTESTSLDDVKVQSIILESQDGSAIFPTELEVGADVKVAADGYLDAKYMTALESSKVSEIVLTTKETAVDATTKGTWYMTLVPGTYKDMQVRVNTNKGYFIRPINGEQAFLTGQSRPLSINITDLEAYTEYVVASEVDWTQALGNIAEYLSDNSGNPSIGNTSTIRVIGDVEIAAAKFRAAALSTKHTINIVGDGSITIDGDLTQKTSPASTTTLGIMNFNVPVTVKGDFKEMAEGDQLTFAELNVVGGSDNIGDLVLDNAPNFKSIVVKSGVVTGVTTYRMTGVDAALTMENVAFADKVTVSAMTADGNDAAKKTTKVNFNNCSFTGGLDVADSWNGKTAVTVNGGQIVNEAGNAILTVGTDNGNTKASVLYVKGDVTADIVDVQKVYSGQTTLDVIGDLTVNSSLKNESAGALFYIEQDASVTIGQNAIYNVTANATTNGETWIEGALNNYGIVVIADNAKVQDSDLNNTNRGKLNNYGLLYAPVTEWYEDQRIVLTNSANSVYAITNVDDVDAFETALEVEGVNGVQLTGTSYVFEAESDYSNVNLYASGANISMQAPKCVFGNLTIQNGAKLTLDNGETAATIIKNTVDVYGTLIIDNDLTDKKETTLESVYFYANKGSKVTNLRKAIVENGWGLQEGADITM